MKKLIVVMVMAAAFALASCKCPFCKPKAEKGAKTPAASATKAPAKK